jgi:hypothetical protein
MREDGPAECGKISKALWLTETFQEEIEADLQRYYGLDYLDLFRPGRSLGWRKLLVLIDQLPPEGALNTAIRSRVPEDELAARRGDPAAAPWSTMETLTAMLIDEVRMLAWSYASAHSKSAIPKPTPLPRPGAGRTRRRRPIDLDTAQRLDPRLRGLSVSEAQARLDYMTGRER